MNQSNDDQYTPYEKALHWSKNMDQAVRNAVSLFATVPTTPQSVDAVNDAWFYLKSLAISAKTEQDWLLAQRGKVNTATKQVFAKKERDFTVLLDHLSCTPAAQSAAHDRVVSKELAAYEQAQQKTNALIESYDLVNGDVQIRLFPRPDPALVTEDQRAWKSKSRP